MRKVAKLTSRISFEEEDKRNSKKAIKTRPLNIEICYGVRLGAESSVKGARRLGQSGGIFPDNF